MLTSLIFVSAIAVVGIVISVSTNRDNTDRDSSPSVLADVPPGALASSLGAFHLLAVHVHTNGRHPRHRRMVDRLDFFNPDGMRCRTRGACRCGDTTRCPHWRRVRLVDTNTGKHARRVASPQR